MFRYKYARLGAVCLLAATIACSDAGSPISPSSAFPGSADVGPNGETLKVTAPELVFPVGNVELDDDDPDFEFGHASAKYSGDVATFTYDFELYEEGTVVAALNLKQSADDTTEFEIPEAIDRGEDFTWRVRARLGSLVGPWSAMGAFSTEPLFSCAALGPNALGIIRCHRDRFPQDRHPDKEELAEMMFGIARDFNIAKVPEDHPWGVLIKTSGNNCNGISCDIVCSGNGATQDQYDVLQDENVAKWGSPVFPFVPRVCQTVK